MSEQQAELLDARRALMAAQAELFKTQIVAATRLDTIRLLGFISNREGNIDLSGIVPDEAEPRALLALELQDLANSLRERAASYDALARKLENTQVSS